MIYEKVLYMLSPANSGKLLQLLLPVISLTSRGDLYYLFLFTAHKEKHRKQGLQP